ncbi:MAG: MnhB domain-containing protein [Actinomycetota bacterium]
MTTATGTPPPSRAIELAVRAASPLALLVAAYLFFAGHNRPGGGFAAGLVIGAVMGLRMIAGLPYPDNPGRFLASGAIVAGLVAVAPMLWGDPLFDQVIVEWQAPILGKVKTGTAAVFDLGVVLIVVGLVVAVLDGLGADDIADTAGAATAANDQTGTTGEEAR